MHDGVLTRSQKGVRARSVDEHGVRGVHDASAVRCYARAKRVFDVLFALAAVVITCPVWLLAAIAIRVESRGNPFFLQTRMGLDGRSFRLVKLRGMYVDAHRKHPGLYDYASLRRGSDFFFHRGDGDDPRVTRVGRFCRRHSIDELPNFINVLRGDMKCRRPTAGDPQLAHLYGDNLDRFLSVKPGITSPAKARARDDLSFAETLRLELEYVDRQSFLTDLRVVAATVQQVARGGRVA